MIVFQDPLIVTDRIFGVVRHNRHARRLDLISCRHMAGGTNVVSDNLFLLLLELDSLGTRTRHDTFSKEERSYVMSRIKSKFTSLDNRMLAVLLESGIPFEMYPACFGKPDFAIGRTVVVFCDSSFWHGRNWAKLKLRLQEGGNPEYWVEHVQRNRMRDRRVTKVLKEQGFQVLRFWDVDLKARPEWCLSRIRGAIESERDKAPTAPTTLKR